MFLFSAPISVCSCTFLNGISSSWNNEVYYPRLKLSCFVTPLQCLNLYQVHRYTRLGCNFFLGLKPTFQFTSVKKCVHILVLFCQSPFVAQGPFLMYQDMSMAIPFRFGLPLSIAAGSVYSYMDLGLHLQI
jgi:hypothetical protein